MHALATLSRGAGSFNERSPSSECAEGVESNPAREVTYLKSRPGGFHSWTVEEVEKFEARLPIGTKARLALALLLYTGQRRSDVILFGRQHVRDGWLKFTQTKNRRNRPISLELPVLPPLQRAIDATATGDLTFLVNGFNRPFTAAGFGNKMRQWCDEFRRVVPRGEIRQPSILKHLGARLARKASHAIPRCCGDTG
jgi:integrase